MIPLTKQLADFIALARATLAPLFVWLGIYEGIVALPLVVILIIVNWTGDSIDGVLARKNPIPNQTWIGKSDLEIDILVSFGLLSYMTLAGLLAWQVTGA